MKIETIVSLTQYFSRTAFVFIISSSEIRAASVKKTMAALKIWNIHQKYNGYMKKNGGVYQKYDMKNVHTAIKNTISALKNLGIKQKIKLPLSLVLVVFKVSLYRLL